jgi:DNA-binding CsgD family transcriptional regulator
MLSVLLDAARSPRLTVPSRIGVGSLLGFVAVFIAADVVIDMVSGTGVTHVILQSSIALITAPAAFLIWRSGRQRVDRLQRDLSSTRQEAERWRAEARAAVEGLSLAIDHQFDRWALSPAEREVGLLLLKGLSLKEIATTRDTSERTAREQARAVYRKSGLTGRAELAAFFLEDLLAPRDPCRNTDTPREAVQSAPSG